MSTHNIGFYEDLTKIILELSSNTHLISSAAITHSKLCQNTCVLYELRHEKTVLRGFQPSSTQTRLYSHRRRLEA